MPNTQLTRGSLVTLKPTFGCCNSTACFEEWEICEIESFLNLVVYIVKPTSIQTDTWRIVTANDIDQVISQGEAA